MSSPSFLNSRSVKSISANIIMRFTVRRCTSNGIVQQYNLIADNCYIVASKGRTASTCLICDGALRMKSVLQSFLDCSWVALVELWD